MSCEAHPQLCPPQQANPAAVPDSCGYVIIEVIPMHVLSLVADNTLQHGLDPAVLRLSDTAPETRLAIQNIWGNSCGQHFRQDKLIVDEEIQAQSKRLFAPNAKVRSSAFLCFAFLL